VPTYEVNGLSIEIRRDSVLVDTNVFINAFLGDNETKENYRFCLENCEKPLVISMAVVIEAWGLIVGSKKNWIAGKEFLSWLITSADSIIILPQHIEVNLEYSLVDSLGIDWVDAILYNLAHDISEKLALNPPMPLATLDLKDFSKLKGRGLKVGLLDMGDPTALLG
jgi:predicted nucleic acid-binding protein